MGNQEMGKRKRPLRIISSKLREDELEELFEEVERQIRRWEWGRKRGWRKGIEDIEKNTEEELGRLFSLPPRAFLREAYRVILGREADPIGFTHFMEKLLTGKRVREEILWGMRYSKEGRERKTKLKGWWKVLPIALLCKVPLGGGLLRRLLCMWRGEGRWYELEGIVEDLAERFAEEKRVWEERVYALGEKLYTLGEKLYTLGEKLYVLEERIGRVEARVREEGVSELWEEPYEFEGGFEEASWEDFYSAFEEVFRGEREKIKLSQQKYVELLERHFDRKPELREGMVVDLGVGRGEFLELMRERGFKVVGCDLREDCVRDLKAKGFEVYQADALDFLRRLSDRVSVITAFQVIEHLEWERLFALVQVAFEKLEEGGVLILETINPWAFEAFPRFYLDYTHVKPIPPELLAFLYYRVGFRELRAIHSDPIKEKAHPEMPRKYLYMTYALWGVAVKGCD